MPNPLETFNLQPQIPKEEQEENKLKEIEQKEKNSPEKENPFELEFYVTDHSADNADTAKNLKELYADIKKDGIDFVRSDWRWKNIEPKEGNFNEDNLERYKKACETMKEAGLKEPTIILSDLPDWAKELYQKDKEKFFVAYRQYAEKIRDSLNEDEQSKISRIQILNELNNKIYTPIEVEDVGRLCDITREVFQDYNPDLKLSVTVIAANISKLSQKAGMGEEIKNFLPHLKEIKDKIDIISVDYYPGLWHLPLKEAKWKSKDLFKQAGLLKEVFEEIESWGKDYELGEVGLPTKSPWGGEKTQRYFYDTFFRAYKHLLLDFRSRGLKLPSQVGFYEAIDEAPKTALGKILRKTTPFPEHDLGMREASGRRKMILEGSPHLPEEERAKQPSQLSKIISYLRTPMKKAEKK